MRGPEFKILREFLPYDHARVSSAQDMVAEAFSDGRARDVDLLDFGCGAGDAMDFLAAELPGSRYHGVDIEGSPEVSARTRTDSAFRSYDGTTLPYDDRSFDLVYSRQVFEHVRRPDTVTREILRVLRPGGLFVGSMSNLEPYHSFSIFNYTPYGVYRLIHDNGLELVRLRPGPEGVSLIVRQLTMRRIGRFPLVYPAVWLGAWLRRWDVPLQNYLKLRFSGHICFIARAPL